MSFNKTIQMCIFGGNPNGRIMCELSNWNGRVYKVSRNDLNEFANRIIYYESQRGCPFRCAYCLSSIDKKVSLMDFIKKTEKYKCKKQTVINFQK